MKRWIVSLCFASLCLAVALAAYRSFAPAEPSLARYAPPGALLYLQCPDFSGLLTAWNGSQEKERWLHSADYGVFSRSRLFLRLKEASDQFAAAAGLPPDMKFVSEIAGSESALALYDIGKLQLLYITKLEASKADALLESRTKFATRDVGGTIFYLRQDAESGRQVAFATSRGYLLLATREDLLAGALQLLAGNKNPSIESEPWWTASLAAAGQPGNLRLLLNLEKIVPSPYFRSYWIQKNVADMKVYSAAVSDLFLSDREYREERVLLKKAGKESAADTGSAAVADLARFVPTDAGTYQIHANPSAGACLSLLEATLLVPPPGPAAAWQQSAPQVQLTSGETGGNSDLETRIDQAPWETRPQAASSDSLKTLLGQNAVLASLHVQNTEWDGNDVFVRFHTALVLLGSSDWNGSSVRSAITEFLRPMLTTGELGLVWQNAPSHQELDGLWTEAAAVRGKYLFLSDDARLLDEILSRLGRPANTPPAAFVAGFNHTRERAPFVRLTNLLDNHSAAMGDAAGRAPEFFSENIASLSSVLSDVSSERILVRDVGDKVLQTVVYEWAK